MDMKTVSHAVANYVKSDDSEKVERALSLLISKDGVFRTDEKWVYSALKELIVEGYVKVDGNTLCIGHNFEQLLLSLVESNPRFAHLLKDYRRYIADIAADYSVSDSYVLEKLQSIKSTDEKILYLTQVVSETFGKLENAMARTQELEAKLREMDISLSVMESITFEDSDR